MLIGSELDDDVKPTISLVLWLPEDQLRFQNKSMICYFLHLQSRRGWTYATTSISKFPQILRQFMRDYNQDNFGYEPEFYSSYEFT